MICVILRENSENAIKHTKTHKITEKMLTKEKKIIIFRL